MTTRPRIPAPVALVPVLTAALLLAGCPPAEDPDAPAVAGNDAAPADEPVCLLGEPFVADGAVEVRDAEPGDAVQTGSLRWERYEGCERFVIDLRDEDGNPADRAGRVTAEVLRDLGVVRVQLHDVERGDANLADAELDGPLARGAYVVTSPDGRWKFVDVHLAEPAEAFLATLDDPARVIVDLRPGGGPVPDPVPREHQVVVLEPRPGEDVAYPLTVTGYARTFEANVVVRLERDGQDVYDDFTTATGWADAWGHFTFTIDDGPTGPITLHVGDHSAKDGTWEGAAVQVTAGE